MEDKPEPVTLGPKIAKKSERKHLRGESCPCCKYFFSSLNQDNPEQKYSRHRYAAPRPKTPPGFWSLDITSPEAKRTKKIHPRRLNGELTSTKEEDKKIEENQDKKEKENNQIEEELKKNQEEEKEGSEGEDEGSADQSDEVKQS